MMMMQNSCHDDDDANWLSQSSGDDNDYDGDDVDDVDVLLR